MHKSTYISTWEISSHWQIFRWEQVSLPRTYLLKRRRITANLFELSLKKMYHGALILWYLVWITIDYQPFGLDWGWAGQEGLDLVVRVQEGWLQGQVPKFTTPKGNQHFVILKKYEIFFPFSESNFVDVMNRQSPIFVILLAKHSQSLNNKTRIESRWNKNGR